MTIAVKVRFLAVILGVTLASATSAIPAPKTLASMVTGSVTSQPIGHYEFCQRHKDECGIKTRPAPAPKVTEYGWTAIHDINSSVNNRIMARTDMQVYGREEYWEYPVDAGDCEDYALQKRKELSERGFALSDLLITVVRKPDGEGHAVLTVRTSKGDFILDNLNSDVKLWSDTDYTFLKRQASFDTGRWVTIEDGRDLVVGALR
ncbi:transglutaminase [Rhizobiales bacterium RZME27]|jgi:predicted transglutaminase-like cysteine proteinase|uniref:Transglutaminase n=1 Tax=Endobacterium cereale TaxID=2663029 RepID=A0A6A8A5H2_9HYPH|nr:transglutaminase-like cysteine peptidase [Endobacterium cereale]MQY44840.1 transglutaminase [Endobacterium cereale]